jgi:hypothetical protein
MPRVVALGSFWQEAFAAALAAPGEGGAPTFRAHSCPEPMLSFPSTFRGLEGPLHNKILNTGSFGSGYGRSLQCLVNCQCALIFSEESLPVSSLSEITDTDEQKCGHRARDRGRPG